MPEILRHLKQIPGCRGDVSEVCCPLTPPAVWAWKSASVQTIPQVKKKKNSASARFRFLSPQPFSCVCYISDINIFFLINTLRSWWQHTASTLDMLPPQALRNSCWIHPDVGCKALLACPASANAPGWEYTPQNTQSLMWAHNTFKHVWSLNKGILRIQFFNPQLWAKIIREMSQLDEMQSNSSNL